MSSRKILEQLESGAFDQDMDELIYGEALRDMEEKVRLGVMACAVPLRFNASLALTILTGPVGLNGNSGRAFEKVTSLPFVSKRCTGDWEFSDGAREFFLEKIKNSHNGTLREIDMALSKYYGNESKDPITGEENPSFQFLKAFHTANVDREKGFEEFDRLEGNLPSQEAKNQASYSIFRLCEKWDAVYDYHKENYYYYEGMRLYHQDKKREAFFFLRPVADSGLINRRVAIASHLTGMILSKNHKEIETVERYYLKAIEIGKEIGDKGHQAQVLRALGDLLAEYPDRWEETERAYQESFDLNPNPDHRKKALTSWAAFYRERKLYHKAEEKIEECLRIIEQLPHKDLISKTMCYNELGHIHTALGRFEEAIGYYEKSLKIEKNEKYKAGIKRFIQEAREEQKKVEAVRARFLEHGGPMDKNLTPRQRLQVMCGILKGSNALDNLVKERERERERDE
ncbi:MAG: tetratricopeptide repeat protein [Nitrospinae bacterium]|nr:tetratricopeptide repeat protein [Nitrospinota bacterium]